MAETLNERRARLKQEGKCTSHSSRPVEPGFSSCRECIDRERLRSQKRYTIAKESNKCTKHRTRDVVPGHSYCEECLARAHLQNLKMKENGHLNGMCTKHPFRLAVIDHALCEECIKDRRGLHHLRKEQGMCVKHAFRKAEIGINCEECWFRNISNATFGTPTRWPCLKDMLEKQKYICDYTGMILTPGTNASIDHKIPRVIVKNDDLRNLHWIDLVVNCSKRDIPHDEFLSIIEVIHNRCNLGIFRTIELEKQPIKINSKYCKSHSSRLAEINSLCLECWFRQAGNNAGLSVDKRGEVRDILSRQKDVCPYTGHLLLPGSNAALDHIIPRAQHGPNEITNLQWVVDKVNIIKYDRNHSQFLEFCAQVDAYTKRVTC